MKKFLPKTSKNSQGFTLIELLVVIAIIAVLATIGLAIFSNVQGKARDSKRKSDVGEITKALDVAKGVDLAKYPALVDNLYSSGKVPADPLSTQVYCIAWSLSAVGTLPTDPTSITASCVGGGAAVANVNSAWAPLTNTILPADTAYKVRVCAYLEDTTASPRIVCSTTQAN